MSATAPNPIASPATDALVVGLRLRLGLWIVLIAGWAVCVGYMGRAVAGMPDPVSADPATLVGGSGRRLLVTAIIFSGMELAVVLAALWPWASEFFATRTAVAVLGLVTWLIMTTPADLNPVDAVHQRWLLFMIVALSLALAALLAYRAIQRLQRSRLRGGSEPGH